MYFEKQNKSQEDKKKFGFIKNQYLFLLNSMTKFYKNKQKKLKFNFAELNSKFF